VVTLLISPTQTVFTSPSYPNFTRFLRILNVPVAKTSASFSFTRDNGKFEWGSDGILAFLCQPANIFNARKWRLLWDMIRFNACVRRFIADYEGSSTAEEITIDEYLTKHGYSDTFRDDFLIVRVKQWSKRLLKSS
jgi:predicted NAD/FAD-binding protein